MRQTSSAERSGVGIAGLTAADSCLGINPNWQPQQQSFGTPENSLKMNGFTESVGLSEVASVPTRTKGAEGPPEQGNGGKAGQGGFTSVYFFAPGIMSDSDAEQSKVIGVRFERLIGILSGFVTIPPMLLSTAMLVRIMLQNSTAL